MEQAWPRALISTWQLRDQTRWGFFLFYRSQIRFPITKFLSGFLDTDDRLNARILLQRLQKTHHTMVNSEVGKSKRRNNKALGAGQQTGVRSGGAGQ